MFNHILSRNTIPTCNILGVDIAAINMEWLLKYTQTNIKNLTGDYMCVSNVHTTVMAYEDSSYCSIQNGGIMAIPDGGPLSFVGKKKGYLNMTRVTGPDYLYRILEISAKNGYRHFFYGSKNETLEKIKNQIAKKYKDVEIAGMYSPPFRTLSNKENNQIIEMINNSHADFIWVGLGAPKQEKWMASNQGKISGFMVGIGAGFDYLAGNLDRAPQWMQKNNLEWLYRLILEPKRLFKRYLITNIKFIYYILKCEKK